MAIRLFSAMAVGLQGKIIEVEVDIFQGMPAFQIVGLGDTAVQEAKERIRSAIKNSGMKYPQQKKVVNLGPAYFKKTGPQFDLVMALGILAASGVFSADLLKDYLILGELNLNGDVRGMNGVLTLALFARALGKKLLLPDENFIEASLVKGVEVLPVSSLQQLVEVLLQGEDWQKKLLVGRNVDMILEKKVRSDVESRMQIRFEDIVGQQSAKRALMVAAAGGHHVLMQGVPGIGKTLLAKAMAGILPPLSEQEMLEVWQIHSCAGLFQGVQKGKPELWKRMFREVQPSISLGALLGGGAQLKPGEISLAHHGVLFLDEIAEFPRGHLESLRQPLESKKFQVQRVSGEVVYPAQFTLVGSMNPCPCGYFGDEVRKCTCSPAQVLSYQKKISGPILDRFDLILELKRPRKIVEGKDGSVEFLSTIGVNVLVEKARAVQRKRFFGAPIHLNSQMGVREIQMFCQIKPEGRKILDSAEHTMGFSFRRKDMVLKTARTIADIAESDMIENEHLAEALQYSRGIGFMR